MTSTTSNIEPLAGQRRPTVEFTLEVGRILHWPPGELAGETLGDRDAWRCVVPRASTGERSALIVSLHAAMLRASPEGLARLRRARERPADADIEPAVYGDLSAVPVIKGALALMPAEVRTVVVRECAFLAVGRDSLAWTASSLFLDIANRRKDRVVVLSGRAGTWLVLHECAHCWHSPVHESGDEWPALTAVGEVGFKQHLREVGFRDIEANEADDELLADGLAYCWAVGSAAGTRVS